MKRSCSANATLMRAFHDASMNERRPAQNNVEDILAVVRVLLLLQGAILIATTLEAIIWGVIFSGTVGVAALMSGLAAAIALVARVRVRPDRRRIRRLTYVVEGAILATFLIDLAAALVLAHALPPLAAIFTDGLLPLAVVWLLRRSTRAAAPAPLGGTGLVVAR
jgi:hypothetical protein